MLDLIAHFTPAHVDTHVLTRTMLSERDGDETLNEMESQQDSVMRRGILHVVILRAAPPLVNAMSFTSKRLPVIFPPRCAPGQTFHMKHTNTTQT